MALLERITADIVAAMRAKDALQLTTLRSIKTALDKFQKDQQKSLDESGEQAILQTLAKQRREAADAFRNGNREESALQEDAELRAIEGYMLELASDAEIDAAIERSMALLELPPVGDPARMRQMGAVIKNAKEQLPGKRVDGQALANKVKNKLGAA
ncbi:MAG: GatB/YqeY domain-containing protein [Acidobacteria bacterium]|nr:GatB/YqeY domain-containing protein [Acidobacteriota bacterium]